MVVQQLEYGPAEEARWRRWAELVAEVRAGDGPGFEGQLAAFEEIFRDWPAAAGPPPAWRPGREELEGSNVAGLMRRLGVGSYPELHRWSVREREAFWRVALEELGIAFERPPERVLDPAGGPLRPRWLPGARLNIADSCFRAPAGEVAVVVGREGSDELETTTFGELEALADRFAAGLAGMELEPGDPVALYMPMTVECVAAYLGAVRAGCPVVSIADSFSAEELRRRLEIGGARAVVTVDGYLRGGRTIDLMAKVRAAGAPRVVVIAGGAPATAPRPDDLPWSEMLGRREAARRVVADPEETTNVLFSSGTTATPKAIPWTHLTPVKCAMDGRYHHDIRAGEVVAWPTNIGWMMGPWLIYAALVNGAAVALWEGSPADRGFAGFVGRAGVTMLGVVPSLVRGWRASGQWEDVGWDRVRVLSSTGEPSSRRDYLWLMSLAGYRAPVVEYCGGTEIGGGYVTGTVAQPASPATFTTPALGLDMVVLRDSGRPAGEGEIGEVFLVPPSIGLSQRLLNRDHDEVYHEGCPRGPAGEVLRRHGDQMARLPGGGYRAQGRADDAMNLGGIKVSSLEIERVLDAHPEVRETAAVGVQTGREGAERLVVFAVPEEGAEQERLRRELGVLLREHLNPLFRLHDLVLAGELPRTASNKLMRRELRARYAAAQPEPSGGG